jgi:hypothetical protein
MVAKTIWGIIAHLIGANDILNSMQRVGKGLSNGSLMILLLTVASICWYVWKCRKITCFDKNIIKHPCGTST